MTEHQCEGSCWRPREGCYPCPNNGKYYRDGKWYCGMHDPVRIKEKADKRQATCDAESALEKATWKRRDLERRFCEGKSNFQLKTATEKKRKAR